MIMPGINDENRELATKVIKGMAVEMSSESDKDGLGYAALTDEGELFGERWLYNSEAFKDRVESDPDALTLAKESGGALECTIPEKYGVIGKGPAGLSSITAITLHTRYATTARGFQNCHPFVTPDGKTSLIHNGVINNHMQLTKKYSTCDSEAILHEYISEGVADKIINVEKMAKKLYGYYACGVFATTSEGFRVLDVFKDGRAQLHGVYIKELKTPVLTTKLEFIQKVAKDLGLTISQIYKVKDDMILRFNPYTGTILDYTGFNSNGYYSSGSSYNSYDGYHSYPKADSPTATPPPPPKLEVLQGGELKESGTPAEEGSSEKKSNDTGVVEQKAKEFLKGLNEENLVRACDRYLLGVLERTGEPVVEGDLLSQRLSRIHKSSFLDRIIDRLCSDEFGWEECVDKETNTWLLYRKSNVQ
jgi:hypothetical protein